MNASPIGSESAMAAIWQAWEKDDQGWSKFRALWGARTEEELRIRCAALGVDFKRFKETWGPVWEMSE